MYVYSILDTIQKIENLNYVARTSDKGNGGAHHSYKIMPVGGETPLAQIEFQQGPRFEEDSKHGVVDQDLLEIVRDRLTSFSEGDLPSKETEKALEHLEIALMYLNKRTEDRYARGVLGQLKK